MAARKSVWALDFDGVVCDSVGESSLSAWQVSQSRQRMRAHCLFSQWTLC